MVDTAGGQTNAGNDIGNGHELQIPDMVLMYACIFTYEKPKAR